MLFLRSCFSKLKGPFLSLTPIIIMEKLKISFRADKEKYHFFVVNKDRWFLEWLDQFLEKLGVSSSGESKSRKIITEEGPDVEFRALGKLVDKHDSYVHKGIRVDVFYGHDKVSITVNAPEEAWNLVKEFLDKTTEWLEAPESQE